MRVILLLLLAHVSVAAIHEGKFAQNADVTPNDYQLALAAEVAYQSSCDPEAFN